MNGRDGRSLDMTDELIIIVFQKLQFFKLLFAVCSEDVTPLPGLELEGLYSRYSVESFIPPLLPLLFPPVPGGNIDTGSL